MNICEYKRLRKTEMECHRLKAFHAALLEVSVWEPFGEKYFRKEIYAKPNVRVADYITQNECGVFRKIP